MGNNPLDGLPTAICSLPKLEILFAAKVGLRELPEFLALCPRLRMLGVKDNLLTSLDGRHLPQSLEWLIAANNQIQELPNINLLQRVRKLMLSHNQLTCQALTPIAEIAALEMLRIAANRLEAFPDALRNHPRLAWIAVGGNPFTEKALEKRLVMAPMAVDFADVVLKEKLGSGAGATVSRGEWHGQQVAVKIWDAEQFSDGTAMTEWGANRVAGYPGHPSLVSVLGTFEKPKRGMLLELLEEVVAAGGPPTFTSVTRDSLGLRYTVTAAVTIAHAVAGACEYLHSCGIMHGDIYLHNTLVALNGPHDGAMVRDVRLSDFGGAAVVDDADIRKLEVRSFGWLLQDLLESLAEPQETADTVLSLRSLREACGNLVSDKLPSFTEVVAVLSGLKGETPGASRM